MIHYVGPQPLFGHSEGITISTAEQALSLLAGMPSIAVDTETEGLDPHTDKIVVLSAGNEEHQVVVDCRHVDIRLFKDLLENKPCLLHNGKFDYKFLLKAEIRLEMIYDTMLAEAVLYNGYEDHGYKLDQLAERYVGVYLDKSVRAGFSQLDGMPLTDKQIRYAAEDVAHLHKICQMQTLHIKDLGMEYAVRLENRALKAFAQMEFNGMILDVEKWRALAQDWRGETVKLELELEQMLLQRGLLVPEFPPDLFGQATRMTSMNFSSPKQMLELLHKMGYAGIEKVSKPELAELRKHEPFVEKLIKYKEAAKIVSTYGEGFIEQYVNKKTGRVHTSFWQVLNTFRVSSGDKYGNAPNVQNIPKTNDFRNCFVAPPGYKWVSCDYASQELAIMADFSGEEGFIDVLNRGEDLHSYVGTMMTGKTITKADKKERDAAKTINFGKPYGMSPHKLSATLQIPIEEAEEKFRLYAENFPKLEAWLKSQASFGKKYGYILTNNVHKGRRWFPEMHDAVRLRSRHPVPWKEVFIIEGSVERESMNTPIQGTGAVMVKLALVELEKEIRTYGWQAELTCTVHDQIDVCVKAEQAEAFCARMAQIMEDCAKVFLTKVELKVDPTITDCWTK